MKTIESSITKGLAIILFLLITCISCFAGGDNRPVGGKSAALGGASVGISDVWSGFNNQAGLAELKSTSTGIYYENRYLLKQLGLKAAVFAFPTKHGTIVSSIINFGYSAWNESKLGIGFANHIGKYLCVGVQLDYIRISKEEPYGNYNLVTFEAGILAKLSPKLTLGTHIYNPFNSGISDRSDEKAPSVIKLGIAYKLNEQFLLTAETEKNIYQKVNVKTGIEYHIIDPVFIRAGFSSNPSLISFGAGFCFRKFIIDISSSRHQVLGFSPQMSISYAFE